MMAAALSDGETTIENAAREPEISDLAEMLNNMGADIRGAGESAIVVCGVKKLHGVKHRIMPDRIEAGTYLCAVVATGGEVFLRNAKATFTACRITAIHMRAPIKQPPRHYDKNAKAVRLPRPRHTMAQNNSPKPVIRA